jgi:hypothetical protein
VWRARDDPGVVARVRRRGDERRELLDALPAADLLQLAPLLESVDERDCVDRLALPVQLERRAVDLRVALAVEVTASRISLTAPIAPGESIIAPRTDSSGSQVLGRDGRGTSRRGATWATRPLNSDCGTGVNGTLRGVRAFAGAKEIHMCVKVSTGGRIDRFHQPLATQQLSQKCGKLRCLLAQQTCGERCGEPYSGVGGDRLGPGARAQPRSDRGRPLGTRRPGLDLRRPVRPSVAGGCS